MEEPRATLCCGDEYITACALGVMVNSRSLQATAEFSCCDGSGGFDTRKCLTALNIPNTLLDSKSWTKQLEDLFLTASVRK